jgi:spore maturation protein A
VNPAGIIAPAILATFISTLVAVIYCKMKDRGIKCR